MGYYNEEREPVREESSFNYFKATIFLLGALLAPSFAIAVIIFIIFMRWLKWKPTVTIFPLAAIFLLLISFFSKSIESVRGISISNISSDWTSLVLSYLYISLTIGIVFGYVYILYKAMDLKRYPEYKHIAGWAYGFQYTPSPLDKWRKKKNISSLRKGNEFDYEKAPIGVLDAPVKKDDLEGSLDHKNASKATIAYRYYSEAMEHTLITGKTGSGKALHIGTDILTRNKGWIKVGDVEVGDTLYNESGNYTKVLATYYPMTEDHYEITFSNGEVVKACGDHLWNIGNVEEGNTYSTRDLCGNFNGKYMIKHSIDGIRREHKIIGIRRMIDSPEDYVCFTVDSPSKLFLVTKSYIPTHNTVTMLSLIQNDILVGNPVCVIDFKKSPDLIYFLSKWASENGREFYHFVSGKPGSYKNPYKDDQATYDPLANGEATAKADMILNLRTWDSSSEVFKMRTQDVLQSLFFLLERTPRSAAPNIDWDSGGLAQFVSALDLDNFRRMIEYMAKDMQAGRLNPGDARRYNTLVALHRELSSKTKSDLKAQIVELLSIARTLIVSSYGDWLATGASEYHIDLMDIATSKDGPIVLFSFNQQEEPEFAQYIGSIVMSDLSRVSATKGKMGDTTNFGLYIDEFQTLHPSSVKDSLEKARSSKMYITLSLQSIDQIVSSVDNAGEAMANAILDTCANFIFHDGSGYDTAEKMSKIIGKSDRYKYRTGSNEKPGIIARLVTIDKAMVSKDIERDWLVPPSEFQSLESPVSSNGYKATAYIVNKAPRDERFRRGGGALARKVHVVVAEETAEGVPLEFKKEIFIPSKNKDFYEIQNKVNREYEEAEKFAEEAYDFVVRESDSNVLEENQYEGDGDWVIEEDEALPTIEEINDYDNSSKYSSDFVSKTSSVDKMAEKFSDGFVNELLSGLPDLDSFMRDEPARENSASLKEENTPEKVEKEPNKSQSQLDLFNQLRNGSKK